MSYITDFEGEFTKKLEDKAVNTTEIVRWVSENILESYKNGVTAGKKASQRIRKGQTNPDVATTKAE